MNAGRGKTCGRTSRQPSAISSQPKPIHRKGREGRNEGEIFDSNPFAAFALVAVKLLWLIADCYLLTAGQVIILGFTYAPLRRQSHLL
jgi:hypothetical protein